LENTLLNAPPGVGLPLASKPPAIAGAMFGPKITLVWLWSSLSSL
jgi:hypothetical protein